MAPHSSTLARKIPWMEEPGRLKSMGSLRVRHDWVTSLPLFTFMHWRRKWQPESQDGGTWWAAVYGVTQSRTRLKRLSSSSSSSSMTMCSWTPGNISKSSLHTSVVPRLRIIDLYHFIIVMSLQWSLCWEIHAQKFKGTQILQRQIQSIWSKGTQIPRRNESSIFV